MNITIYIMDIISWVLAISEFELTLIGTLLQNHGTGGKWKFFHKIQYRYFFLKVSRVTEFADDVNLTLISKLMRLGRRGAQNEHYKNHIMDIIS